MNEACSCELLNPALLPLTNAEMTKIVDTSTPNIRTIHTYLLPAVYATNLRYRSTDKIEKITLKCTRLEGDESEPSVQGQLNGCMDIMNAECGRHFHHAHNGFVTYHHRGKY